MTTTIYIVEYSCYDAYGVEGAYATREQAEEHLRLLGSLGRDGYCSVQEMTVEDRMPFVATVYWATATDSRGVLSPIHIREDRSVLVEQPAPTFVSNPVYEWVPNGPGKKGVKRGPVIGHQYAASAATAEAAKAAIREAHKKEYAP